MYDLTLNIDTPLHGSRRIKEKWISLDSAARDNKRYLCPEVKPPPSPEDILKARGSLRGYIQRHGYLIVSEVTLAGK